MKNKIIAFAFFILAAFTVGFSSPKSVAIENKPSKVYSLDSETPLHFQVLQKVQEEPSYTSLHRFLYMPITKINEHMKSEAQILERIASEKETIAENELLLQDEENLDDEEIDGYNENIFESNLIITTLEWTMEGNSNNLSEVSDQIYQTIQDKVDSLEVGKSISFVGDEPIVDTDKIKHLAHEASESEEDYFYELPFGSITNRHDEILEYKIVGITKSDKDTGFNLHLHSQEQSVEDYNMCKSDIDVSLEIMSDISEMV